MKFFETRVEGAYLINLEKIDDERGFFARTWDSKIFKKFGLNNNIKQCNISLTKTKGTIRGMHLQISPHEESKLVRCVQGKVFDVIVDLRSNSKTYLEKFEIELDSTENKSLFIPEGFAHGFQTMDDNTDVYYQISQFFKADFGRGILWNDPIFNINWPILDPILSDKDKLYDSFNV